MAACRTRLCVSSTTGPPLACQQLHWVQPSDPAPVSAGVATPRVARGQRRRRTAPRPVESVSQRMWPVAEQGHKPASARSAAQNLSRPRRNGRGQVKGAAFRDHGADRFRVRVSNGRTAPRTPHSPVRAIRRPCHRRQPLRHARCAGRCGQEPEPRTSPTSARTGRRGPQRRPPALPWPRPPTRAPFRFQLKLGAGSCQGRTQTPPRGAPAWHWGGLRAGGARIGARAGDAGAADGPAPALGSARDAGERAALSLERVQVSKLNCSCPFETSLHQQSHYHARVYFTCAGLFMRPGMP